MGKANEGVIAFGILVCTQEMTNTFIAICFVAVGIFMLLGVVASISRRVTHLTVAHYCLIEEIQNQNKSRKAEFESLAAELIFLTRTVAFAIDSRMIHMDRAEIMHELYARAAERVVTDSFGADIDKENE